MIIYLEGVDGSGKSRLASAIAAHYTKIQKLKKIDSIALNAERQIPTRPGRDIPRLELIPLLNKLESMAMDNNNIYILDRGPLSDIIYRTFDEYDPVIGLDIYNQFIAVYGIGMIHVLCDTDAAYESMIKRGEDNSVSITRHTELRYLMSQIVSMYNPMRYDFEKENEESFVKSLIAASEQLRFAIETQDSFKWHKSRRSE